MIDLSVGVHGMTKDRTIVATGTPLVLEEGGVTVRARWFRAHASMAKAFVKGEAVALAGPVRTASDGTREMVHPSNVTAALAAAPTQGLGLRPRYGLIEGVKGRTLDAVRAAALAALAPETIELLPVAARARLELPTLVRRYVLPLDATPPVTTTRITVTPGDAEITQGEPLRVQAAVIRLSAAGRAPTLHVRARAESANPQAWHVERMTATPDGEFEVQIARVDRDLDYFLTAGDARTGTYRVTMLPRPAVTRFRIHYAYPPHTGLARAARTAGSETEAIEAVRRVLEELLT